MTTRDLFCDGPTGQRVLSVSELTFAIKEILEGSFPTVWVCGEISNLVRPGSGHVYLTLKDQGAQLRAAIWRNTAARLRFDLADGLEVVCRGHVDVYAPRGSYQLIIEEVQPKGLGALELALRQLRDRLAREGLFAPERKRPLPPIPRRIAVVTSPTGAAIRDFLQVLGRRWRGADVLIVPSRVQGEGAAEEIAAGIAVVNRIRPPVDCLVVTRGGGSLEDLWAFNEELVVRAIFASQTPVISAVGHEIDVTLSDLVADVRALTPSEAAELVAPDAEELAARLRHVQRRLCGALRGRVATARSQWEAIANHPVFRRPLKRIHESGRRLDEAESRMVRAMRARLLHAQQEIAAVGSRLDALSPLGVLGRGYSVTRRTADGRLIRSAGQLRPGEQITTRLAEGEAISRVERIEE